MNVREAALKVADIKDAKSPSLFIREEYGEVPGIPNIHSPFTNSREVRHETEMGYHGPEGNIEINTKKSRKWYATAGLVMGVLAGGAFAAADSVSGGHYTNQFDKGIDEVEMVVGNASELIFDHQTYMDKRTDSDGDGDSDWDEKQSGTNPYKTYEQELQELEELEKREMERKLEEKRIEKLKNTDSDSDGVSDWDELNVYNTDPYEKSASKYDTFLVIGPDDFRERIVDALKWYKEEYPEGYEYADNWVDVIISRDTPASSGVEGEIYIKGAIYVEDIAITREGIACSRLVHLAAHNEESEFAIKMGAEAEPEGWGGKNVEVHAIDKAVDCKIGVGSLSKEKKIQKMQSLLNSRHYNYNITKEEIERIINSSEYKNTWEVKH